MSAPVSRTPSLAELLASRELPEQPVDMLNPPALPEHRFWRQWVAAAVVVFAGSAAHAASNSPAVGMFAAVLVILSLVAFEVEARRCPDASWAGLRPLLVEPGPAGWELFAHHFAAHYESECRRVGLGDWLDAGTLVLERAELGPCGFTMRVRGPRAKEHAEEFAAALDLPELTVAAADARGAVFTARPVMVESSDRRTLRAVLSEVGIDAGEERLEVASIDGVPSADVWRVAVRGPSAVLNDFDTGRLQRMAAVAGVRSVEVMQHHYDSGPALIFTFRRTEPVSPTVRPRTCTWRQGTGSEVILGRDSDTGQNFWLDLFTGQGHVAVQGATRSGKSAAMYVLLGSLAKRMRSGDVVVGGVDSTGLLLGPFAKARGEEFRSIGGRDLDQHVEAVTRTVEEMDHRIARLLEEGVDKLSPGEEAPLLLFVCEEYPSLLATLATTDAALKPTERRLPRVRAGVQRLVQEGAKVGVCVVMIAQRFEASVVDGAVRSNLGVRVSLRVDNADTVRMLHPDATAEVVERVRRFKPGEALIEQPGAPARFIRFDLADYKQFRAQVDLASSEPGSNEEDDEQEDATT